MAVFNSQASARSNLGYILLSAFVPVVLVLALWALLAHHFGFALFFLLLIAALMEGRVQVGGRVPHDAFFCVHLIAAVLLGVCLVGAMLFKTSEAFFLLWAWILLVPTVVAGVVLWYRGFNSVIKKAPQTLSGAGVRES